MSCHSKNNFVKFVHNIFDYIHVHAASHMYWQCYVIGGGHAYGGHTCREVEILSMPFV